MKIINTFLGDNYKRIIEGNLRDSNLIDIDIQLFKLLHSSIWFEEWYYFFEQFRSRFIDKDWKQYSSDDKIYQEFSNNKFYINDFLNKKTSLRLQAFLGKCFVDIISTNLRILFPEKDFIVFSVIDKQRISSVVVGFYSVFPWYTPILSEPFLELKWNYLYAQKITNSDF